MADESSRLGYLVSETKTWTARQVSHFALSKTKWTKSANITSTRACW